MKEINEIRRVKIYKRKLRDGLFITILLWFVIFILSFYKDNNFVNFAFRFILVANGILFVVSLYVFLVTFIKSIEVVKISKELEYNTSSVKNIFKM